MAGRASRFSSAFEADSALLEGKVFVVVCATRTGVLALASVVFSLVEQGDIRRHDLQASPLVAFLVLPFVQFEASFDVDCLALRDVLAHVLSSVPEHADTEPCRLVFPVASLIPLAVAHGHREVGDGVPVGGILQLRVTASVSNESDSVD